LCGVDAAAEEGGGIWLHFSTLHGSWKDSVCQYSFHYFFVELSSYFHNIVCQLAQFGLSELSVEASVTLRITFSM